MSDVWDLGRQQDCDKDRTRAIFSNQLLNVIFLDLWTEVLLYGPLKPAHISAGLLWAACSGQTQLSTQAASRVPLTFKYNISIPHPFQMAPGSCENPCGRFLRSKRHVVVNSEHKMDGETNGSVRLILSVVFVWRVKEGNHHLTSFCSDTQAFSFHRSSCQQILIFEN